MTNQELLDRYIYAVKILLPLNKRDDIAAEIRSNLLSLVEDEEELWGRSLDSVELGAILKQHGHPVLVASRYRDVPSRQLIGPALLPLYWFVLRGMLLLVLAINVISAAFLFSRNPHSSAPLIHLWRDLWLGEISAVGWITLAFIAWERFEIKFRFVERWNPRSLPAIPRKRLQPRPMVQIIAGAILLALWTLLVTRPRLMLLGSSSVFEISSGWYGMRLPLWLMALAGLAMACLNITRFRLAEWLPLVRIGINLAGLAVCISLLRAGDLLVAGANWDPSRWAQVLTTVNFVIACVLAGVCVLYVLIFLHELRIYARRRRNPNLLAV
ncbi:MAG TPA: hypothetical protein VK708_17150 [Bryobacteraceae bacterium]|nr:hypothetical protein [Bryobacteraceae bacterium]